jgi:hypothetical protein
MSTSGIPPSLPSRESLMEMYKTIFDTWRSQVDSSWQRSSYFAGFEIAAIGGCWLLVSNKEPLSLGAGIVFSIGGLILTLTWHSSTKKTQDYVRHWWNSLIDLERSLNLAPHDYAQQLEKAGNDEYRKLPIRIPLLFSAAWILLLVVGAVALVRHL